MNAFTPAKTPRMPRITPRRTEETKEEMPTSSRKLIKKRRSSITELVNNIPSLPNLGIESKKNLADSDYDMEELAGQVREENQSTLENSIDGPTQNFQEMKRTTLSFKNPELEEAFRQHTSELTRSKVRRAFLVTLIMHLLLGILEPILGYSKGAEKEVLMCRSVAVAMSVVLWWLCYHLSDAAFYTAITKRLPWIYFLYSALLIVMYLLGSKKGSVDENCCPKYGFLSGTWSLATDLLFTVICFSSGMRLALGTAVFVLHLAVCVALSLSIAVKDMPCFLGSNLVLVPLLGMLCAVHGRQVEMHLREDFCTRCNIFRDRKRRNDIIESMLPADIAAKLKTGTRPNKLAKKFDQVTVLFCYICGFDDLSLRCSAAEIVSFLHLLYSEFDICTDLQQVYKVEAIAQSYICVSGLRSRACTWNDPKYPEPDKACHMAALMMVVTKWVLNKRPDGKPVVLKIGLHTGEVVAGVTGSKTFSYHLFGDTVNTASRMASTCEDGKVQLSKATYDVLSSELKSRCTCNPTVDVKGKGDMQTYSLDLKTFNDHQILKSFSVFQKSRSKFNPQFTGMVDEMGKGQMAAGREAMVMEKIRVKGLKFVFKRPDGRYQRFSRGSLGISAADRISLQNSFRGQHSFSGRVKSARYYCRAKQSGSGGRSRSRKAGNYSHRSISRKDGSFHGGDDEEMSCFNLSEQPTSQKRHPMSRRLSLSALTQQLDYSNGLQTTARQSSILESTQVTEFRPEAMDDTLASTTRIQPLRQQRARLSLKTFARTASLLGANSAVHKSRDMSFKQDSMLLESFLDLEQNYQLGHNEDSLPNLRRVLYTVATILLVVLYTIDIMLQSEMNLDVKFTITLRMAYLGVVLFSIYASYKWNHFFIQNMQPIVSIIAVLFCLHVNAELLWHKNRNYLCVNIVFVIIASTLLDLRYTYVIATDFCSVVIYSVFIFTATENLSELKEAIGFVTYLLISCYIGSYGCWKLEKERRYNFLHKAILEQDRDMSEQLLKNMLPGAHHVHALIQNVISPEELDRVTILFSDFKGYTAWCHEQEPKMVYEILNVIYNAFDKHLDEQGVYKLETIGDAFVVVGGLEGFSSREHHALSVIKFGFCILHELDQITKHYKLDFSMRIGIHTGPAVGGVVGIKKPRYLCWGKSSLIANLLESESTPGRILISRDTLMELSQQELHDNNLKPEPNPNSVKLNDEIISTFFINGNVRPFLKLRSLHKQNSSYASSSSRSLASNEHSRSLMNLLSPERGKKYINKQLNRAASHIGGSRRGSLVFGARRSSISNFAGRRKSLSMRRGSVSSDNSTGTNFFRATFTRRLSALSKRDSMNSDRGSVDSDKLHDLDMTPVEVKLKSSGRSTQSNSPALVVPSGSPPIGSSRRRSLVFCEGEEIKTSSTPSPLWPSPLPSPMQSFDEKDSSCSNPFRTSLHSHQEVEEEEEASSAKIELDTVKSMSPKILLPRLTTKLVTTDSASKNSGGSARVINFDEENHGKCLGQILAKKGSPTSLSSKPAMYKNNPISKLPLDDLKGSYLESQSNPCTLDRGFEQKTHKNPPL